MANDVYEYVQKCSSILEIRGAQYVHTKHLMFSPPSGPLEFVAMDILGLLPRTNLGNQFCLVISDRHTNLTRAIAISTTMMSRWRQDPWKRR